jgi:hypothetical protein
LFKKSGIKIILNKPGKTKSRYAIRTGGDPARDPTGDPSSILATHAMRILPIR